MTTSIPSYAHLKVKRKDCPRTKMDAIRNLGAFQSALIRGDREVELLNRDSLAETHRGMVRVPYDPANRKQWETYDADFYGDYEESRGLNTQQPDFLEDYVPSDLYWEDFTLEFVKTLGAGGFGVATLWNVYYETKKSQQVVIKMPVKSSRDITGEAVWHRKYEGASHVVQLVDIQKKANLIAAERKSDDSFVEEGAKKWDANERKVVVLEYAEHGSLFDMMAKADFFDIEFPNRVLWEIWDCLVKGVASVAYQPAVVQEKGEPDLLDKMLRSIDNPARRDRADLLRHMRDSHHVHFDLEEQNILIGEDEHHPHNPIFKLHDFGDFSYDMRECWTSWKEDDYWYNRKTPKRNRVPPETFVKDWDSITTCEPDATLPFRGDDLSKGYPTAGRYGTWTNVFLIGQVMEAIISKKYITHPATATSYTFSDGDESKHGKTYGWRLMRPKHDAIEKSLRELIMRCQCERPADRPSLSHLLKKISERKEAGFEETEQDVRRFWESFWERKRGTEKKKDDDDGDDGEDKDGVSFQKTKKAKDLKKSKESKGSKKSKDSKGPNESKKSKEPKKSNDQQPPKQDSPGGKGSQKDPPSNEKSKEPDNQQPPRQDSKGEKGSQQDTPGAKGSQQESKGGKGSQQGSKGGKGSQQESKGGKGSQQDSPEAKGGQLLSDIPPNPVIQHLVSRKKTKSRPSPSLIDNPPVPEAINSNFPSLMSIQMEQQQQPQQQQQQPTSILDVVDTEMPDVKDTEMPDVKDTEMPDVKDTEMPDADEPSPPTNKRKADSSRGRARDDDDEEEEEEFGSMVKRQRVYAGPAGVEDVVERQDNLTRQAGGDMGMTFDLDMDTAMDESP